MKSLSGAHKKAVLVTGAAGFIAHHLIEALLRARVPVVGIDNFDPFYHRSRKEQNLHDLQALAEKTGTPFSFYEQDLRSLAPDTIPNHSYSTLIHLAAKAGVRPSLLEPEEYLLTNVQGTLRALELARRLGIKVFLFGSSSSVYGDDTVAPFLEGSAAARPLSPYAASKRAAELYCQTYASLYGLQAASLRFFTVYGPRQRPDLAIHHFAQQIVAGKELVVFGDGKSERDYTFVSDIVGGILQAKAWAERQPPATHEIFNLGGGKATPLHRLISLVESSLGMKARITAAPMQPGDVLRTLADISKAEQVLGYRPMVRPEEGIPRFVEWFLAESAQKRAA